VALAQESGSLVCSTIKTPHDLSSDRREAGRLLSADTIVFTWVVRKDPQVHSFVEFGQGGRVVPQV